jgi:hypothetical protein
MNNSKLLSMHDPPNMPGLCDPTSYDWEAQKTPWVQPTTLAEANKQLNHMRGARTNLDFHEFLNRPAKVASVVEQTHLTWNRTIKTLLDDIATNGRNNTTHYLLSNLDQHANYLSLIYTRAAWYTVTTVLSESKHVFWIKRRALTSWIESFLPSLDVDIFNAAQLEHLKGLIQYKVKA